MPLLAILLTVAFVVLKLTGVVAWGWLIVISPLLILAAITVVVWVAALLIAAKIASL